jgi:PhoPQ-activated pathogenicity-related protein
MDPTRPRSARMHRKLVFLFRCALVALILATAPAFAQSPETALDRYVATPDPNYHYELINTYAGNGYTGYVVELTSQQWRSTAEVDHPLWKHWLTVVRPDQLATSTGLMIVSGGSNESNAPSQINPLFAEVAVNTHSVVAEVRMVPNQPLVFADDPGNRRKEDGITVYSWDKFLKTGDETWPLRLPMTKAVVRAMDTVTAFCASAAGGGVTVDKFVVGGASKRGWTSWTTAAVDKRVVGIIPVVIDLLNLVPSFEHHYRAYGFWAPAIADFERTGIMQRADTPQFKALLAIEDPYSYRDRLTMPKFIVNAAGDQYFVPDSSQFYVPGLKGDTYLRYVPNADHSLKGAYEDAAKNAFAFYQSIVTDSPRPQFSWNFDADGAIRVVTQTQPSAVRLWQATDPNARDFRLQTIGPAYTSSEVPDQGNGVYIAKPDAPERGWTAYFMQISFPSPGPYPYVFTTGVRVTPDTLPFAAPPEAAAIDPPGQNR